MKKTNIYRRGITIAYSVLFFLLGFFWFLFHNMPIEKLMKYFGMLSFCLLYLLEAICSPREKKVSWKLYVVILFLLVFFCHFFVTGLLELGRFGEVVNMYSANVYAGVDMNGNVNDNIIARNLVYSGVLNISKEILKLLFYLFYDYVLYRVLCRDTQRSIFIRSFAWGIFFSTALLVAVFHSTVGFSGGMRMTIEFRAGNPMHPNTLALLSLLAFFVPCVAYSYERHIIPKICHILSGALAIIFLFFSGGRSMTLGLLGAVSYLFFSMQKRKYQVGVVFLILILGIFLFQNQNLPFVKRFTIEKAVQDQGSGRLGMWQDYYKYMAWSHYLLGVGPLSTTSVIIAQQPNLHWGFIDHPSSTYIYVLLTYGLGGLLCYMTFLFLVAKRLLKNIHSGKAKPIYFAIFLSFCIWSLTGYLNMLDIKAALFWILPLSQVFRDNSEPYETTLVERSALCVKN